MKLPVDVHHAPFEFIDKVLEPHGALLPGPERVQVRRQHHSGAAVGSDLCNSGTSRLAP
jgi:hypothetical protein